MKPTALVITTVHWPDDTRIRERLIRSLAEDFRIVYAAKKPGPTDTEGVEWVELPGGRFRRNLAVLRHVLSAEWDVLVLHDPETLLAGWIARILRRRPVVFDVHENYPAVAGTREWVPDWMRSTLSRAVQLSLRISERLLTITLAEPGYASLFRTDHPVFPNYPDTSGFPEPQAERRNEAVYLGDATVARGVDVAIEACDAAGIPLRIVGRVSPEIEAFIRANSTRAGDVLVEGVLPNPDAVRRVSEAAVGLAPLREIPNYRHSQPTKVLEYLSLGVPVVASDLPGTRALVEGLEGVYLVDPGDVSGFASAIGEAVSEEAKGTAMAQAPEIRNRFKWPEAEVRVFYRSLL